MCQPVSIEQAVIGIHPEPLYDLNFPFQFETIAANVTFVNDTISSTTAVSDTKFASAASEYFK